MLWTAVPAWACAPPPPPPKRLAGETEAAYAARLQALKRREEADFRLGEAKRQSQLWTNAPAVFVGQVERVQSVRTPFGSEQMRLLRPVRWIKGAPREQAFWLKHSGYTACGPMGGGDAAEGRPGQRFVLFAGNGPLSSDRVLDSVGPARAEDRRVVAALAMAAAR